MTFEEVEQVLGVPLPPSARAHATWWSNNTGTHVGVRAWRDIGWKTSRVDIAGGKLVFVREDASAQVGARRPSDRLDLRSGELSLAARRLIEERTGETGSREAAIAAILHEAALARRANLIGAAAAQAPRVLDDSTDLIRGGRDER